MINSLHIRNFKGIRRADVGLERLTVIVGPNASGKTSFLEALQHLSRLWLPDPKKYFQGQRDPLHLYRRKAFGEEMELSCSATNGELRLRVVAPAPFPEDLLHPWSDDEWTFRVEGKEYDKIGNWREIGEIPAKSRMFPSAELMRLDVSRLAAPSSGAAARLGGAGQGLASVLAFMALNQPDDFQRIQQRLRMVVPTVERIRFDRETVPAQKLENQGESSPFEDYEDDLYYNSKTRESIILDFEGAPNIPAQLLSEGTLLVLGLLTVLMSRYRPDLVLLDDIDRGLHPKAQREVVGLLRTILEQNPELQIVATTHSPYLVDRLRPEEVRLTTLGDDGTVSIASLVEHPDFDKWKDEMAPGEMWSLFGEKWIGDLQRDPVEK